MSTLEIRDLHVTVETDGGAREILRGVTLAGVDSVMCPREDRLIAWERLTTDLDFDRLGDISREVGLDEAIPLAARLLKGEVRGRIVVDVNR